MVLNVRSMNATRSRASAVSYAACGTVTESEYHPRPVSGMTTSIGTSCT